MKRWHGILGMALAAMAAAWLSSADPAECPAAGSEPVRSAATRHALLIGVCEYAASGLEDLPGTRADLDLMRAVVESRLQVPPAEVRTLLDREATHCGMKRAFADLARTVHPGDFVYIHYSGHGSLVKDFNDAGGERTGMDQTLVGYGARRPGAQGLDAYDVLDDERNGWLGDIADRLGPEGELVVVTDACHSASNTRGPGALVARAAPFDPQITHPYAHGPSERHPLAGLVAVAAAGDLEQASEFPDPPGPAGGIFTRHWAEALAQARPEDTWREVFERAGLGVKNDRYGPTQHPQISGVRAGATLLGGHLQPRPGVLVAAVDGDTVTLNVGRLVGATVGSLYAGAEETGARARVVSASETQSLAHVESGSLAQGDFVVEREHAYPTAPVRRYLWPVETQGDRALAAAVRKRLDALRGFAWAATQAESDLTLALLHPRREQGRPQFAERAGARETFPVVDPAAGPELWVLDRGERLVQDRLAVPLDPAQTGIETLARNLERYRRVVELRRLSAAGAAGGSLGLTLIPFEHCARGQNGCFQLGANGQWYRRATASRDIAELGRRSWSLGTLFSFRLENLGIRPRFAYLFDLGPDGSIAPLYPQGGNAESSLLDHGQTLDLADLKVGLVLDRPGDESLLILTTQRPIDPRLLTQEGYEEVARRDGSGGDCRFQPLECLLTQVLFSRGTRAETAVSTGTWDARLIDYRVDPEQGAR